MEKSAANILVIDDEARTRELLRVFLSSEGYAIDTASNGREGIDKLSAGNYSVVICDLNMPGMDGLETLDLVKSKDQSIEVILITGYGSVESAVNSMKKGAFDFVTKPFELEELGILTQRAIERRNMQTLLGLYDVSKLMFSKVKFNELLDMVIQLACQVLDADDASLMLFDENKKLYIAACTGLDADVVRQTRLGINEGIAGRIAQEKKPVILQNSVKGDPRFEGSVGRSEIKSSIVHPIVARGSILGILNIERTRIEKPFCRQDLKKAAIFVSHIAQAIENANLYRELEMKVDELNRAYDELQSRQEQLVVSEKLSALGNMTAGVAHELNNPLMVIMGFTEHLKNSHELPEGPKSMLEKIYLSAVRCRRVIKNLLSFARADGSEKETLQTIDILEDVIKFVSHEMKLKNIELVADLPDNLPRVEGNSDLLRQVFVSILSNAAQSISSIRSTGRIVIQAIERDGKVILRFADNGTGIPQQNLKKIFDPFFTTKKVGEGTGLGLSACYGILTDHGGSINVESIEGEGAAFTVGLPIASRSSGHIEEYASIPEQKISRVKKILIIDDEDFILDLYREVLEEHEYHVDAVSNGSDGLDRILCGSYDLVILDWRMPGMDGKEVYERVHQHDPDLAAKIIFVTGDTVNIEKLDFTDNREKRFLSKPFKVEELMDAIKRFETEQRIESVR